MTDKAIEFGYVAGIELTNIRAFKKFRIDLNGEDGARMLSLIIGRNGAGKSTLLRCIALGLCHQSDAAALLAESDSQLVSEGADQGSIRIWMSRVSGEKMGDIHLVLNGKSGHAVGEVNWEIVFTPLLEASERRKTLNAHSLDAMKVLAK